MVRAVLAVLIAGCAAPPSPEVPHDRADALRREGRRADALAAYDRILCDAESARGETGPRTRFLQAKAWAGLALLDPVRTLAETPGLADRAPFTAGLCGRGVDLRRRAAARLLALRGVTLGGIHRNLDPEHETERWFLLEAVLSASDEAVLPAVASGVPAAFREGAERLLREEFRKDAVLLGVRKAKAYGLSWDARKDDVSAALRRWGDALERLASVPGQRRDLSERLSREGRAAALLALEPQADALAVLTVDEGFYRLAAGEHLEAATRSGGEGVTELARNGPTDRARDRFGEALRHLAFALATAEELGAPDRRRLDDLPVWFHHLHRCSRAE